MRMKMKDKNFEKYLEKRTPNVNKFKAENTYEILTNYIFSSFEFVKENKKGAFYEYLYSLIADYMGYEAAKVDHGSEFNSKYCNIKKRIDLPIQDLKYKEMTDFDYENEILVIAFRILKYFNLKDDKLFLKFENNNSAEVRVYNDYQSNVFTCEIKTENVEYNYVMLKHIEKRVYALQQEVEYLNDFILNYYQQDIFKIFKITKIIFDKHNVESRFVQGEVKFRASFKIIQKLIGPLYLNKESYGIRELLQNAVDACLKRESVQNAMDDADFKEKKSVSCIEVKFIDGEEKCILIKDNGIGMNEDIILNKFLTIGESVKESDNKIGKFGIGILAAFLLADKMKFKTCWDNQYIYESDEIKLQAVKTENEFINTQKKKADENFQGTEITLFLKPCIYNNEYVKEEQKHLMKEHVKQVQSLFGKKNNYGNVWYGYPDKLNKMQLGVPRMNEFNSYNDININDINIKDLDDILKLKQIREIIDQIQNFMQKMNLDANLSNKIINTCKQVLENVEKLCHLEAYSVLDYLESNRWYLLNDDGIKIQFFDDKEKMNYFNNFSVKDIIANGSEEKTIVCRTEECTFRYFFSDVYAGNVFCNHMLIPSKYQFETPLAKAFKILPTILVNEGKEEKIQIDLAREKCKLVIDKEQYEEIILKEILKDCLNSCLKKCEKGDIECNSEYLQHISWLYYTESNCMKKVIKNAVWLRNQVGKHYYIVFLNMDKEAENQNMQKEVIDKLSNNCKNNIIVEFINDSLYMNTTYNRVRMSDLYVVADHKMILYLDKKNFQKIKQFSTKHMRALVLAAKNVYGKIDVNINNQLQLNSSSLRDYKEEKIYEKCMEETWRQENNDVFCLNYKEASSNQLKLHTLPADISAIMKLDVELEGYNNIFTIFRNLAHNSDRQGLWNGFQQGIYEIVFKKEDDSLSQLLLNESKV